MKNHLSKAVLLAGLGLTLIPAAKAADLYVGFNDLTGNTGNDYVIDLGSYNNFTSTSTYLGSINSALFTQAFGSDANALSDVAVGAVAGGETVSGYYLMATGHPSPSSNQAWYQAESDSAAIPTGVYSSTQGQPNYSWDYFVAQSSTVGDSSGNGVAAELGNPEANLVDGTITVGLWESTVANGIGHSPTSFTELGTLTIDANTSPSDPNADAIIFNGANAVPEPSTYGILACGSLLVLALRRRFSTKVA